MAEAKPATSSTDDFVVVSDGAATEQEIKIQFEAIGESFVGVYMGMRTVPSETGSFQQARFQKDGEIYFINANYSLREGLRNVRVNTLTKIEYSADIDTGQSSPMRAYTVAVSRKGVTRPRS